MDANQHEHNMSFWAIPRKDIIMIIVIYLRGDVLSLSSFISNHWKGPNTLLQETSFRL